MKRSIYPFSAIVGQDEMKLALLLAAVDWRIGVLLRGDKGAGKTTAARGIADLLPQASPFVNLPIGVTEDRLLGGLHLERTLKGDPALKPGLISEAHGGVLYVDEINLLPAHLGDALLDAASSGINVIEREGLSASHAAEFVLLGSMNPEEGTLRPQLLDRFALAVDVTGSLDPAMRQVVVERRIAFEQTPSIFIQEWHPEEERLRTRVNDARNLCSSIVCSKEILASISEFVCEAEVVSLRADLAIVRASRAYAALLGDASVNLHHIATVLPLALSHRRHDRGKPSTPRSRPPEQKPAETSEAKAANFEDLSHLLNRPTQVFAPQVVEVPNISPTHKNALDRGVRASISNSRLGPVTGSRKTETPAELDARATLNRTVLETGITQVRMSDLHERVRRPQTGTRYLLIIDSSGSHATQARMRLVKGAAHSLLSRSFKNGDEVTIISFRGAEAEVLLKPTRLLQDAISALEYLPTGGRTPLAHALNLAQGYLTPSTVIVLLTDGRANVPLGTGDAWQEALAIASQIQSQISIYTNPTAVVIDTEISSERLGRSRILAEALGAEYISLDNTEWSNAGNLELRQPFHSSRPGG